MLQIPGVITDHWKGLGWGMRNEPYTELVGDINVRHTIIPVECTYVIK